MKEYLRRFKMFKFKKGDEVCITYGSAFGSPSVYMAAMTEGSTITACKETPDGNAYRLKHYVGWWSEENLVAKSKASKNFSWQDEGSEPTTYTQNETKCDTGDSGEPENLWNVISELSDIRASYSVFDDEERAKYHALSVAINKLREELIK
jgi:hypothetical protein